MCALCIALFPGLYSTLLLLVVCLLILVHVGWPYATNLTMRVGTFCDFYGGVSCWVMNASIIYFMCSAVGNKSATPYILKRDKRRRRKSVRTLYVHGRERGCDGHASYIHASSTSSSSHPNPNKFSPGFSLGLFQRALCPLGPVMCPLGPVICPLGLSQNQ